ncbi:class I SAM-dependent methyltransferase [Cohnella faecalis]|uniref:SAM-dependent methyltransferase n=1 Tax=Cohnella faecalis TaxID=2315694 RepID=A0A398CV03_9BACL|nr:class I SAM-dependent methyltransferase [Cohnella faecalis]RIE03697.1 SAM-dependent methyltransferase [Cohnella faecalis]
MGFLSVLSMAQRFVTERAVAGDTLVDATAGNGVDTLFLARLAGERGRVFAFDVQEAALANTRDRLDREPSPCRLAEVTLCQAGHETMAERVPRSLHGGVRAVMFNLGYLPGADPAVITRTETTLAALEAAVGLLAVGGALTAVLYPGHEGGGDEAKAVEEWFGRIPGERAQTVVYRFPQKPAAPYLVALEKR